MHEPWKLVLLTTPDGSTVPTRVWLPPLSGVAGEADAPRGARPALPRQQGPSEPLAAEV